MSRSVPERVGVLETGMQTLNEQLKELVKETRLTREAFSKEVHALRSEVNSKGSPTDWRAIGGAVLMTASLMSALMTGANFWYSAKAGPVEATVARIEQQMKEQNPAVLVYRVNELERKVGK